jgi:hypothetical protein
MKEYRLRKFQVNEESLDLRLVYSKFYKSAELAMMAAQDDYGTEDVLQWVETNSGFFETQQPTVNYDLKTFEIV